ncbi:MAG: hypothetical protein JO328_19430 [Hyphomicrobiales bacterium]|nr:hypothetical protein [Hyphomicrobiales bacterium]MBV8825753.1 hypothetical protein [Hyphomicrobiales bacterium]
MPTPSAAEPPGPPLLPPLDAACPPLAPTAALEIVVPLKKVSPPLVGEAPEVPAAPTA